MSESRWHGDCFRCDDCTSTCLHPTNDSNDGLYKRFITMGSVRYGMRLGAVSPPPPGAGPRYRSQCCWPTTAVSGPRILTTAPINSFDIISCANGVRMTEDATSEQPQQATVRDHVLYSTKCLLKSQLKRCALVRPQVYARLCEYSDGNGEEEDILTLDRLPRFRFGGNRANTKRDFDKKSNEQRLKDLTDRFKRGPIPPPRVRHTPRTPPVSPSHSDKIDFNISNKTTPFRSASFSQVDYSVDDKKYIRRRHPINHEANTDYNDSNNRSIANTLPRYKNPPRNSNTNNENNCQIDTLIESSNLNSLYEMLKSESIGSGDKLSDQIINEIPEKDINDKPQSPTLNKNKAISGNRMQKSSDTPNIQEKKRDKSKRRKGIYISQWPNTYNSTENVIPQFVQDGDFTTCSDKDSKLLEDSIAEISKLQVTEKNDLPTWTSSQEEPLSPEKNNLSLDWPTVTYRNRLPSPSPSPDDKDSLKVNPQGIYLLRSYSLSEGELENSEKKSDQNLLVPSDISDCESRLSINNDTVSLCVPRRYSKRPLRGPYGQMLEAEMKKPETERKNQLNNDLKFLEDLSMQNICSDKLKHSKSRSSCSSSIEEMKDSLTFSKQSSSKRKISADCLVINENEQKLIISHQRTTSSPSKLEGFNNEVSNDLLEQLLRGSSEQFATFDANLQQINDTRTHVVVELFDNEKSYVESLEILVTKYLEPLKSPENANLLDANIVDDIFCQIPFLLIHHKIFLDELKKKIDQWDLKQKVGDVLLDMFSKPSVIECYINYVNNWKRVRDIIKNFQSSKPAFAKFLEMTAREHKGKLALDSLLIKPIQKFPKYELLIQRLLKHTDPNHPDHNLLLTVQKEIHQHLIKINCNEREALELEQLREIEGIIEGLIDLVTTDRQYLRHDLVSMAAGGGPRKDRALFLFSDLLLVTSIKRRSGTIRRPVATLSGQGNLNNCFEANKYKLLMKIPLEDLEVIKLKDDNFSQIMLEITRMTEDVSTLNQITELSLGLHCNHSQLDDLIKDMLMSLNKQLSDQQNSDSQLSCLNLTLNTAHGVENISIVFSKPEKRTSWEESLIEVKQKLVSSDKNPCPELIAMVPIRKTRAGLQFTCAAAALGDNNKDVWVCNSDGYVGQVCVLSLQSEPTVTSCNGVCNARILCIASVPGISYSLSLNKRNNINNNTEECDEHGIQFDSSSSSDEDDKSETNDLTELQKITHLTDTTSLDLDDIDSQQSTMWLGTEDGCIHVYNSSDNIRIKKNKIRLQLGASVLCIIYLDNRVFVSLANGDMLIYDRDISVGWNINSPVTLTIGSTGTPISKMLHHGGKLWCGCGNTIKIFNTQTLLAENQFSICNDGYKPISCLVICGNGIWITLQYSAVVKCFHAITFEILCEINVAPSVTKMLTSCDDIIRQHKAACLRVTSLLACKDLLWIGTSAGVLLTMPLPQITSSTSKFLNHPTVSGVPYGHTGHVRFLTFIELSNNGDSQQLRNSFKTKSENQRSNLKCLVISGGDGYEDFRNSNLSEVAGREDSTNHLLLWNI